MTRERRVGLPSVVAAAVAASLLALPLIGLIARAPWSDIGRLLQSRAAQDALWLSLVCSLWATVVAVVVGTPLAWVLARASFPGRRLLRALVVVPLVLPPVVGGVGLLLALGREGLIGGVLAAVGVRLPFTTAGAVVAEAFVALPFYVLGAHAAFGATDRSVEDAARSLGARRWRVFRTVTLPLAAPALAAGTVLAWARALGEFGATITFAGMTRSRTATVPLEVYNLLEAGQLDAAVALSIVLLAIAGGVLLLLRERWFGAL